MVKSQKTERIDLPKIEKETRRPNFWRERERVSVPKGIMISVE